MKTRQLLPLLALLMVACAKAQAGDHATALNSPTAPVSSTTPQPSPSRTATATLTATVGAASSATPASSHTPTASPGPRYSLADWSIPSLRQRSFGEGDILVRETLPVEEGPFNRYVVEYPADGLILTALMQVPFGDGPFPVIIVIHGYIEPSDYYRGLDSRPLGDYYVQQGYAVIMPDLRGYMGVAGDGNPLRMPYVSDVLHLIESLHTLDVLDEERVGVLGHSMGGGIASGVGVISTHVDALVLYGSMHMDQAKNYYHIRDSFSPGWAEWVAGRWGTPESDPQGYADISAWHYAEALRDTPVQIHHGTADFDVPYDWAEEIQAHLLALGVSVELFRYPDAPHTFRGEELALLQARSGAFFDQYVRGDASP